MQSSDPSLGYDSQSYGPVELGMDSLAYFRDFFKSIENLPYGDTESKKTAERMLALRGAGLFAQLIPESLRSILWSLHSRIKTLQINSEAPWIPWELLKVHGVDEAGNLIEGPFLCEAFAITSLD